MVTVDWMTAQLLERLNAVAQYGMQCLGWRADRIRASTLDTSSDAWPSSGDRIVSTLRYYGAPVYRVWWKRECWPVGEGWELRQEWFPCPDELTGAFNAYLREFESQEAAKVALSGQRQSQRASTGAGPVAEALNVEGEVEPTSETQHGAGDLADQEAGALGTRADDGGRIEHGGTVAATHGDNTHTQEVA